MISRRTLLASPAAFAAELFADPPALEKLAAGALAEAKRRRASYCDIRINRYRDQRIGLRLSPERGTGKTLEVPWVSESASFGFGVRVIVDGAWG
jgi:TldD protein